MGTILDDKEHRDIHLLSGLLNMIVILGEEAIEQAIARLIERKTGMVKANDLNPCPTGYTRDSNGVCQKDPLPPDPTHQ